MVEGQPMVTKDKHWRTFKVLRLSTTHNGPHISQWHILQAPCMWLMGTYMGTLGELWPVIPTTGNNITDITTSFSSPPYKWLMACLQASYSQFMAPQEVYRCLMDSLCVPYGQLMGTLWTAYWCLMGTLGEFWLVNGPLHSQWHYCCNNVIYIKSWFLVPTNSYESLHAARIDQLTNSKEPAINWI